MVARVISGLIGLFMLYSALNWILDPFMSIGDVGVACKEKGRRFIGFETNKDNLLLSMKRVENS